TTFYFTFFEIFSKCTTGYDTKMKENYENLSKDEESGLDDEKNSNVKVYLPPFASEIEGIN
ncbi:MAG: hypothetical protein QM530_06300, partial [Phycisphaerales bacterium]|nr:hypothetical protein [Phycisphaerales bacterium]